MFKQLINRLNKINKIVISVTIALSLFLMIEMDVFHHHSDGGLHNECPVCVLNTVASVMTVLSVSVLMLEPVYRNVQFVIDYSFRLIQNYLSYYFPDRAPPSA